MLDSINTYNGLGTIKRVSREYLAALAKKAYFEEQFHVEYRINCLLTNYPKANEFDLNIENPVFEILQRSMFDCVEELKAEEMEFNGLGKPVSPNEIYQYVTDLMIDTIKQVGHLPWQREWKKTSLFNGYQALNFESKNGYRGINFFLLNFEVREKDGQRFLVAKKWDNPYFLTFNQIKKFGGKLRKGSKGYRVVYFTKLYQHKESGTKLECSTYNRSKFKSWVTKNQNNIKMLSSSSWTIDRFVESSFLPILKYYNVFNGGDVDGMDFGRSPQNENGGKSNKERIEVAEMVVDHMPKRPKIIYKGDQPQYRPHSDTVVMTPIDAFKNEQSYYSTLFHEIVHSTGHQKRLGREFSGGKGAEYAFEELIAELGAVFLCSETGILFSTIENSAKYLKGWNKRLVSNMEDDNRFFFRAASRSQAAADFILDRDSKGDPKYLGHLKKEIDSATTKKKTSNATTKKRPAKTKSPRKKPAKQLGLFQNGLSRPIPKTEALIIDVDPIPVVPIPIAVEPKLPAPIAELPKTVPTNPPPVKEVIVDRPKPKKTGKVLSSQDLMQMQFESLDFAYPWNEFLQNPAKNMRIAIWGKPKNGKTAGAAQFANYLTTFGDVLYVFADQGFNKSTQDIWKLAGLDVNDRAFASCIRELDELDKMLATGQYDFVFLDMINTFINKSGIKYYEFEERFLKKYPNISFIMVFEVTKKGDFKGDQGWTHLPDALITVDSYLMESQGRYGTGHFVVWKEGLKKFNPKKYKEIFSEGSNIVNSNEVMMI